MTRGRRSRHGRLSNREPLNVRAHTECRGNSPLWGADYESWPKATGDWTDVANGYLDLPQWGPLPWTELQWATLRNVIELAQEP